jgi:WD40-like Beta Propeller Repeat
MVTQMSRLPRAAVPVVLALVIGSLAVPASTSASIPGANGRIAWQKNDAGGTHIWSMYPDGSDKTDLGIGGHPQWSPDGAKILFGDASGVGGISIMDADGGNRVSILGQGGWAVWSPDGARIAFASDSTNGYDIYVANADGTGVADITTNPAEDIAPAWSPDGTRIAFRTNRSGSTEVWTMAPDGSGLTNLSQGASGGSPDWSPDGKEIVYDGAGIWAMHADGSAKTRVTTEGWAPSWSPDGTRIVFTSGRDLNDEIYTVKADGTSLARLTNDNATGSTYPEDWFPNWQPTAYALAPNAISFGNAVVGSPTASTTVTLTSGVGPITVTSASIGGPNPGGFGITANTCAGVIASGASCSISVRFEPTVAGVRSATLTLTGPPPLGSAQVALSGTGRLFVWGSVHTVTPKYGWNDGSGLALSATSTSTYLHAIEVTNRVGGKWATDSGPYVGVYYLRSSSRGSTWGTPKRLNPSSQHGSRATIAGSGKYVYAAWVSTTKWLHFKAGAPRVLYFRRNVGHGAGTKWSSTIRMTSTSGRVDFPAIAASGSYVYLAWTDSVSGKISLAISSNHGKTWKTMTIGASTFSTSQGRAGYPQVAASGGVVALSWIADPAASVTVRASSNFGASWAGATTVAATTTSVPDIAVAGGRIAVVWSDGNINLRTSSAGTWGATMSLPPTDGYADEVDYSAVVDLFGTNSVGVAYTACVVDCTHTDNGVYARSDLIWRESLDDGMTWAPSDVVAGSTTAARRENDNASIVWPTSKRPYLLWNGWTEQTSNYRLYIRAGA